MKRPFGRGTTPLSGLTNHGYQPLTNWDDPPSGAYPKPPGPTVYGSEFLQHLGVKGDVWGMLYPGYVGFPLETSHGGRLTTAVPCGLHVYDLHPQQNLII